MIDCPPAEWQARQQLAACYRLFHLLGWTELIYNHISLRVPSMADRPAEFLLNPFGLHYSEVCASNLVKVDVHGQVLQHNKWGINPAGFTPHAAIHAQVADAHCVMHTHTTAGMAVACSKAGLSMSNFYAAQLGGRVAYHDFEGITVHSDEGARMLAAIGNKPAVILRNHGLLAWGATLPATFYLLWILQRACEVQVAGAALGPVIEIDGDTQRRCAEDANKLNGAENFGEDLFAAMLRLVDRQDRSWRG